MAPAGLISASARPPAGLVMAVPAPVTAANSTLASAQPAPRRSTDVGGPG